MNGKKIAFAGVILLTMSLVYFVFTGGEKKVEWDFVNGIVLEEVEDGLYEVFMEDEVELISTEKAQLDFEEIKVAENEYNDVNEDFEETLLMGDEIEFSEEYYKKGEMMSPEHIYVLDRGNYDGIELKTKNKNKEKDQVVKEDEKVETNNEEENKVELGVEEEKEDTTDKNTEKREDKKTEVKKDESKSVDKKDNAETVVNGEEVINGFFEGLSNNDKAAISRYFENQNMVENFVNNYDEFKLKYNDIKINEKVEQNDLVMYTVHAYSKSEVEGISVAETVMIGIPKSGDKITYYEVLDMEEL